MVLEKRIGVIICQCKGNNFSPYDLEEIKKLLGQISCISFIQVTDNLCSSPQQLKEPTTRADGLIVIGCNINKYINNWRVILEGCQIPVYACEFIDVRWVRPKNKVKYVQLMTRAYAAKVLAGYEVVKQVKPLGIGKMMHSTDKPVLSRRAFLKMSLTMGLSDETAVIDREKCIAGDGCDICTTVCPVEALEVQGSEISIREEKCRKCGWCSVSCPLGCIQMPTFSGPAGLALIEQMAERDTGTDTVPLIFTCDQGLTALENCWVSGQLIQDNFSTIRVPCLASISPAQLTRALDLDYSMVLCICPQDNCTRQQAFTRWKDVFNSMSQLAAAVGVNNKAELVELQGSNLSTNCVVTPKIQSPSKTNDYLCKSLDYNERLIMTSIIKKWISNTSLGARCLYNLALPFFTLGIDPDKCKLCEACIGNCPIDVLSLQDIDGQSHIVFNHAQCIGCGICVDNCPEGASSINRVINMEELVAHDSTITIMSDTLVRCKLCNNIIGRKYLIDKVINDLTEAGMTGTSDMLQYCENCRAFFMHSEWISGANSIERIYD